MTFILAGMLESLQTTDSIKKMKRDLLQKIMEKLQEDLQCLHKAAQDARQSATHAEVKQENKYDTRGLEASYLAEGQSRRAQEIQNALRTLGELTESFERVQAVVSPGSLVVLNRGSVSQNLWLVPFATGMSLEFEGIKITTVSPLSPLGRELNQRRRDDEFLFLGQTHTIEWIG